MLDDCEIQVYLRDDQSNPENTATVGRELIEEVGVDVLVGTVSSGATATLQELARENQIPLIVAPAAANDITGVNFNEYTFRTSRNNYQDAVNLCEYLTQRVRHLRADRARLLLWLWRRAGASAMPARCLAASLWPMTSSPRPDTTDFTPYMEQILDSGAEALIVTWAGGGFIPMMQAAADLGVLDEMELACQLRRQCRHAGLLRQRHRHHQRHPLPLHAARQCDQRLAGGADAGPLRAPSPTCSMPMA